MNVAAVTHYPVTRLFGRSATGLNATGENDQKNYYDSVRARQNSEWPYIQMLVNMVAAWKKINVYTPFKWNPLFQLTEEQAANVERIKAETKRTLADAHERDIKGGVITPEDSYSLRYEEELGTKDSSYFEDMEGEPLPLGGVNPLDPNQDPGADPAEKIPAKKEVPAEEEKKPVK